jgi:hypothetical protein
MQPGGEHVVNTRRRQGVQVVCGDDAPVRHETEPPDAKALRQILGHDRERARITRVAREDVMGDRDALGRGQQSEHHLGSVWSVVA